MITNKGCFLNDQPFLLNVYCSALIRKKKTRNDWLLKINNSLSLSSWMLWLPFNKALRLTMMRDLHTEARHTGGTGNF